MSGARLFKIAQPAYRYGVCLLLYEVEMQTGGSGTQKTTCSLYQVPELCVKK